MRAVPLLALCLVLPLTSELRTDALDKQAAVWRIARQDVPLEQARKTCVLSPESEADTT
jgi:hypothetical protein